MSNLARLEGRAYDHRIVRDRNSPDEAPRYHISWTINVRHGRQLDGKRFHSNTDARGARRFAKKHGLQFPPLTDIPA